MFEMVAQYPLLHSAQGRFDGANLRQDINAVAVFLDHARYAAHLPLDPAESGKLRSLGFAVHVLNYTPAGYIWQA